MKASAVSSEKDEGDDDGCNTSKQSTTFIPCSSMLPVVTSHVMAAVPVVVVVVVF